MNFGRRQWLFLESHLAAERCPPRWAGASLAAWRSGRDTTARESAAPRLSKVPTSSSVHTFLSGLAGCAAFAPVAAAGEVVAAALVGPAGALRCRGVLREGARCDRKAHESKTWSRNPKGSEKFHDGAGTSVMGPPKTTCRSKARSGQQQVLAGATRCADSGLLQCTGVLRR